jgi:hypothetical protein
VITNTSVSVTATAPSGSYPYGTAPALSSLTPTYSPSVTPTTPATCSASPTGYPNVGTYTISCAGEAETNYTFTNSTGTITVTPVALTIQASSASMTYGGTVPAITASYSGFVNGDSASSLTTQPTCSTTATSSSPVASYPVVARGRWTRTTRSATSMAR